MSGGVRSERMLRGPRQACPRVAAGFSSAGARVGSPPLSPPGTTSQKTAAAAAPQSRSSQLGLEALSPGIGFETQGCPERGGARRDLRRGLRPASPDPGGKLRRFVSLICLLGWCLTLQWRRWDSGRSPGARGVENGPSGCGKEPRSLI
jgi:hypothetical protein